MKSQTTPGQAVTAAGFASSEEAATKGTVLNDLRDRYDELQLKGTLLIGAFLKINLISIIILRELTEGD